MGKAYCLLALALNFKTNGDFVWVLSLQFGLVLMCRRSDYPMADICVIYVQY